MNQEKKILPDNAKLVFKGEIFRIFQWEQELYDGSIATFERAVRPDTVEIIAITEGKIIITEQEQPHKEPFISLPGGRVDPREDIAVAAARELLEETGYVSEKIQLWKEFIDTGAVIWPVHIFIAPNCQKIHDGMPDTGEKIKMKLISFQELLLLSEERRFRSKGSLKEWFYYMRLHSEAAEDFAKLLSL